MFRIRSSGAFVEDDEFIAQHPNVTFGRVFGPDDAEKLGADPVMPSVPPPATEFERVEEGEPEEVAEVWTQTWTVTPIPLEDARAILHRRIAAERTQRERLGVPYVFPPAVAGTIQTRDETDTRNIQGVVTTAMILQTQGITDPVLEFRDADNVNHALTPSQAIAMGMAVSAHVNALYSAKWTHDAAIEQLADTAACAAYDIEAGWPA